MEFFSKLFDSSLAEQYSYLECKRSTPIQLTNRYMRIVYSSSMPFGDIFCVPFLSSSHTIEELRSLYAGKGARLSRLTPAKTCQDRRRQHFPLKPSENKDTQRPTIQIMRISIW